ncbi:hypothetical protein HPB47_001812 [Ixodes persulcatus]|uniref:Uncharacterized protein n=1 Tax=Ixodes persulcatus TaxID=34615 RepID=A0AC60PMY3_IXOPE|nr:hypothetical protein HPB47_001812 [Ixodes persulcatus]
MNPEGCLVPLHLKRFFLPPLVESLLNGAITTSGFLEGRLIKTEPQDPDVSRDYAAAGEGGPPFRCPVCSVGFARRISMANHVRIHTFDSSRETLYPCPLCTMVFDKRDHLVRHVRTHTGEKPYKCPHCPMACAVKWNLVTHMRTHTGERPYKCHLCPKTFAQRSPLTTHLRLHMGCNPFKCSRCFQSFRSRWMLASHEQTCNGA